MEHECWLDCRSGRFVGTPSISTECCPEPDCGDTDCRAMLKAARLAYKQAVELMGKPSQLSFEGRSMASYRSAADLERMRKEIAHWEAICPDPEPLVCGCVGGCMKCVPKRRRPGPISLRHLRRH